MTQRLSPHHSLGGFGSFSFEVDPGSTAVSPSSSASSRPDDLRRQVLKRPHVGVQFSEEIVLVRTVSDLEERQRHLEMPPAPARRIDNPYCHQRLVEFRYTRTVPQLTLREDVYTGLSSFSFGEPPPSWSCEGSGEWGSSSLLDGSPSISPATSPSFRLPSTSSFASSKGESPSSASPGAVHLFPWTFDVPYRQSWAPTVSSCSPPSPRSADTPMRSPVMRPTLKTMPQHHRPSWSVHTSAGDGTAVRRPVFHRSLSGCSPTYAPLTPGVSQLLQSCSIGDMAAAHFLEHQTSSESL
eukprot:GGOE01000501.1.p1 GENE.GGOE01000501.1~~GGOE01000501.1.p1  ORF type:complete len:309 (-),score=67.83 GGOE01000501.1:64-954(-)